MSMLNLHDHVSNFQIWMVKCVIWSRWQTFTLDCGSFVYGAGGGLGGEEDSVATPASAQGPYVVPGDQPWVGHIQGKCLALNLLFLQL